MSLPWEESLRAIADHLVTLLHALGAEALVTEGDHSHQSVADRVQVIQTYGAHLLLCLRVGRDASTHVRGLGAHTPGFWSMRSRRLAGFLLERVSYRTGLPVRRTPFWQGVAPDFALLSSRLELPCVAFECGCLTCPADEVLLHDPAFQSRFAVGMAEGLLRFLDLPINKLAAPLTMDSTPPVVVPVVDPGPQNAGGGSSEMPDGAERAATPCPDDGKSTRETHPPAAKREASQPDAKAVHVPAKQESTPSLPLKGNTRPRNNVPRRRPIQDTISRRRDAGATLAGAPHGVGDRPEPMIQGPDGSWISQRAYAILQQQALEQPVQQVVPRLSADGRIQWPGLPPGFRPTRQRD
jgi:hypothetical protein